MFTGIVETTGKITKVVLNGTNKSFWVNSPLSSSFKVDQSVSHSGVCLTVEEIEGHTHKVTAIDETLQKTNISTWEEGTMINLERCMIMNGRIDGHLVQGHIDTTSTCTKRKEKSGSWVFQFELPKKFAALIIEKGSICINGISLTAFNVNKKSFEVAIIPYTYEHTNINTVQTGSTVNLEFDMIGKYLLRSISLKKQ